MFKSIQVKRDDWKQLHHYKDEYNFKNVAEVITFILSKCNVDIIFSKSCNHKVISQNIKTKTNKD